MLDVSGTVCHIGNLNDRTHLLQKTLQTYRKIDTLVMSAGINPYVGPFLKTPESKWERIFDVNVKSAFLLARDVIPHLEQTKGSILINSSITGLYPNADLGAYSCSKAALNALVVCLALECGRMGVRVNGLLPAVVEQTDFARVRTRINHISLCLKPLVNTFSSLHSAREKHRESLFSDILVIL